MTDVMMANMMGSYGFWIKDGVVERKSLVSHMFSTTDAARADQSSLQRLKYGWRIFFSRGVIQRRTLGVTLSSISFQPLSCCVMMRLFREDLDFQSTSCLPQTFCTPE